MRPRWDPLLVALVAVVAVVGQLAFPLGDDQARYAYAAWAWLDGAVPYRDVFVFKPPGTLFIHGLSQVLAGPTSLAIRLLDVLWTVATALALWALAGTLFRERLPRLVVGMGYALLYIQFDYWSTAQTDAWLNLPLVVAVLAVQRWRAGQPEARAAGAGLAWMVFAGAVMGLAVALKPTAVLVPALVGPALLFQVPKPWRGLLWGAMAVIAGLLVSTALVWLWLWGSEAWPAFVYGQTHLVGRYSAQTGADLSLGSALLALVGLVYHSPLRPATAFMVLGIAGLALHLRQPSWRRVALIWLGWLGYGWASVFGQHQFFEYHYMAFMVPAALGGGAATLLLTRWLPERRRGWTVLVVLGLGAVWGVSPWLEDVRRLSLPREEAWSDPAFDREIYEPGQLLELARYADQTTPEEATLLCWGLTPLPNLLSGRMSPTRYMVNFPFRHDPVDEELLAQLMADLQASPPALVAVGTGDALPRTTGDERDSLQLLSDIPELADFLEDRYRYERTVGRYQVHRLRTD